MTKVFTPSVFITTSREAIDKFLNSSSKVRSFKEFAGKLTDQELENSIICSPSENTGLLEFEINFDSGEDLGLRLKFVETSEAFEQFYASKSISITFLKKIFYGIYEDESISEKTKEELEVSLFENNTNNIFDGVSVIYCSFGVGDDLGRWSDPLRFILGKSRTSFTKDGLKEVEMLFGIDNSYLYANSLEITSEDSLEKSFDKYKRVLNNNKLIKYQAAVNVNDLVEFDNINNVCEGLLKSYISAITGSNNVIVFLPDIKELISKKNISYEKAISEILGWKTAVGEEEVKKYVLNISPSPDMNVEEKYTETKESQTFLYISIDNSTESERLLPDFYTPLRIVSDNLFDAYGKLENSRIVLRQENNLKITKLWSKYGLIVDEDSPTYIFAPQDVINDIIYLNDVFTIDQISDDVRNTFKDIGLYPSLIRSNFTNSAYRLDYFNQYIKLPIGSSFGENPLKGDELSLDDNLNRTIEFVGIPVFTHNLANSNIMDLRITNVDTPLSVYNLGIRKAVRPQVVNLFNSEFKKSLFPDSDEGKSTKELIEKIANEIKSNRVWKYRLDNFKTFEDIYNYIKKIYLFPVESFTSQGGNTLLEASALPDNLNFNSFVLYLSILLAENRSLDKPYVEISDSDNYAITQQNLLDYMKGITTEIDIRTLPFTKLSTLRIRGSKCFLIAKKNQILGNRFKENIMQPFTGMYAIKSFKHFIDSSEFYSEFTLVRAENIPEIQTLEELKSVREIIEKYKASRAYSGQHVVKTRTRLDEIVDFLGLRTPYERLLESHANQPPVKYIKE